MNLLCIDTSEGSAVALVTPSGAERATSPDPRSHAEHLAPLVAQVVGTDAVDAVVVGTGPAPFTGLRVGLVTAEVLGRARGIPVHGVPSLAVLARQAFDAGADGVVTVVTDARRKEVYAGTFEPVGADDVVLVGELSVRLPRDVPVRGALVGRGTRLHPAELPGRDLDLDVAVLGRIATARLARGLDLPTHPLYLRRPDVHLPPGRKRATT
ncbi:MAG: tRNA (adenosine(37)-N6)-threonylcarbamoyltransferase complex dimerization subunit type 1 TsaB [Actinomycetota bacterium]